jgi:hypothetical protein
MRRAALFVTLLTVQIALSPVASSAHVGGQPHAATSIETAAIAERVDVAPAVPLGTHGAGAATETTRSPLAPAGHATWLAFTAVMLSILAVRGRRITALAALLAFSWFGFESSIHSTHHLGDERAASQCVVAFAASAHHPASADSTASPAPLARTPDSAPELVVPGIALAILPIAAGRGPPFRAA